MARTASIAIGGYYKTPTHLLAPLAALLKPGKPKASAILDPCAGEGEALAFLANTLYPKDTTESWDNKAKLYGIELEATRYETLKKAIQAYSYTGCEVIHGDAFQVRSEPTGYTEGVSLLYLNPPYDLDRVCGRLEERFLRRFFPSLMAEGVLVFVVPFYALKASAATLAKEFHALSCFRFPGKDFESFKQVFLLAAKGPSLPEPDAEILAQVQAWSADSSCIPEMPLDSGVSPVLSLPGVSGFTAGLGIFKKVPLDIATLLERAVPWHQTDRAGKPNPIVGVFPVQDSEELLERRYPLAVRPKAAHVATGIAAGVFNGSQINPDDPSTGLPPILVNGCFDREWRDTKEKQNKSGEVIAVEQVQHPRLNVTVLDLVTKKFHTLAPSTEGTWNKDLSKFTTADLLQRYGLGLMKTLLAQCPVQYDPERPGDRFPLPSMARKLYVAQEHATEAMVHLLGGPDASKRQRRGKAALLLGEIGTGKTTIALTTAAAIKAKSVLVICPPNIVEEWADQIANVIPWAEVRQLETVEDVDAFVRLGHLESDMKIAIMSREAGKLSHGYVGVGDHCPKCGSIQSTDREKQASKRLHCTSQVIRPVGTWADSLVSLAWLCAPTMPHNGTISQILCGPLAKKRLLSLAEAQTKPGLPLSRLQDHPTLWAILHKCLKISKDNPYSDTHASDAVIHAAYFLNEPTKIARMAAWLFMVSWTRDGKSGYYDSETGYRAVLRNVILSLPASAREEVADCLVDEDNGYWKAKTEYLEGVPGASTPDSHWYRSLDGVVSYNNVALGSRDAVARIFAVAGPWVRWQKDEICDEPLYQATAKYLREAVSEDIAGMAGADSGEGPRKVALSAYIAKRYASGFDLLIADEAHENNSASSAQGQAAHRLMGLGWPVIAATGSVMNGYARSLFANLWAMSESFREEFDRDELTLFVDRYGYRRRVIEDRDKESGEPVQYGSNSDRVERKERITGEAPGVLPLLVLKHLLRISVTIHKTDLALDLPPCTYEKVSVQPSGEQMGNYSTLFEALKRQIKADMFKPERVGKLWGQMSELPSYFDRATRDVGKTPGKDTYPVAYPESVEDGGVVVEVPTLPESTVLPKEAWLLERIKSELEEGRNVMVFAWHVDVLPRLQRLIQEKLYVKAPILNPGKVAAGKRKAWLDKEIVAKGHRILLVNPVAVGVGLNSLVHFSTVIWFENPACNPLTWRQANGRVDRIGQKTPTRIVFPVYDAPAPEAIYLLLQHKVGVSLATDGLDNEAALEAAGVGDSDTLTGMSLGKQLYEILTNVTRLNGQTAKFDVAVLKGGGCPVERGMDKLVTLGGIEFLVRRYRIVGTKIVAFEVFTRYVSQRIRTYSGSVEGVWGRSGGLTPEAIEAARVAFEDASKAEVDLSFGTLWMTTV